MGLVLSGWCALAQTVSFEPAVSAPQHPNGVALEVLPRVNLQVLQAVLNGRPCALLLDTGASHTTLDRAFMRRTFPNEVLRPVGLVGPTNVEATPHAFHIKTLQVGEATLKNFVGMVLPLEHLSKAMGRQIDGILGMNAMAYAPFLLEVGAARVTWFPPHAPLPKGMALPLMEAEPQGTSARAKRTLSLAARATPEGKPFPLLIDSGSSLTFVEEAVWGSAEADGVAFATTGVNAAASANFRKGLPGTCYLGTFALPLQPFLTQAGEALLGADTLRHLALLIDGKQRTVTVIPDAQSAKEAL